jgi:predicted DNA-binding transcriptional regulator YafY
MSKRESIARYTLIIKKLRKKPATFREISEYLQMESELQEYNFNVSMRTFQRDIDDIRSLYNIDIRYNFSSRVYHIDSEFKEEINERIFEAFDTFNLMKIEEKPNDILIFENRGPKGTEHMFILMHAIKNNLILSFVYSKFSEDDISRRTVEPYALKEFKNRWYLLAKDDDDTYKTFGLDRMQDPQVSNKRFSSDRSFSIKNFFQHCFGIVMPQDKDPEEIILSFRPIYGNYIKTLPLHPSQKIILENKNELRISLFIYLTQDFITELLSHGSRVKVMSPGFLVEELKNRLKENIAQYKN